MTQTSAPPNSVSPVYRTAPTSGSSLVGRTSSTLCRVLLIARLVRPPAEAERADLYHWPASVSGADRAYCASARGE